MNSLSAATGPTGQNMEPLQTETFHKVMKVLQDRREIEFLANLKNTLASIHELEYKHQVVDCEVALLLSRKPSQTLWSIDGPLEFPTGIEKLFGEDTWETRVQTLDVYDRQLEDLNNKLQIRQENLNKFQSSLKMFRLCIALAKGTASITEASLSWCEIS